MAERLCWMQQKWGTQAPASNASTSALAGGWCPTCLMEKRALGHTEGGQAGDASAKCRESWRLQL